MENLKVPELKALAKERGLRGYSTLRKAELIALLTAQESQPPQPQPSQPYKPPKPQPSSSKPQPSSSKPQPSSSKPQPSSSKPQPSQPFARQIKRKKNKMIELNKEIKSSEQEIWKLKAEKESILSKTGPKKFKSQRKRNRALNKRLISR